MRSHLLAQLDDDRPPPTDVRAHGLVRRAIRELRKLGKPITIDTITHVVMVATNGAIDPAAVRAEALRQCPSIGVDFNVAYMKWRASAPSTVTHASLETGSPDRSR